MKEAENLQNTKTQALNIPVVSGSDFIIKIDDTYCEWEYGFTINDTCIDDFIKAIEEKLNIKSDYRKMIRGI